MSIAIIISGSRNNDNQELFNYWIDKLTENLDKNDVTFIHGSAKGIDTCCHNYCKEHKYKVESFPAKWAIYGKQAGSIRNKDMLIHALANFDHVLLIAFPDKDSIGTRHMIKICKKENIQIRVIKREIVVKEK